jgi:hypothetical protein
MSHGPNLVFSMPAVTFNFQNPGLIATYLMTFFIGILGRFYSNDKVGIEQIFKPAIWNKGLYEIGSDNGVKNSKLCRIQKYNCQKGYVFPHCKVLQFMST